MGELLRATRALQVAPGDHRVDGLRTWLVERDADVLVGPAADAAGPLRPVQAAPGAPAPYKTALPQSFSLAGVPAQAVPCGFTAEALPLGMTLATRHFDEATLFRAAHAYERATPWHTRWPNP